VIDIIGLNCLDKFVRQFFRPRKQHLVASLHLQQFKGSEPRGYSRMKIAARQCLVLAAMERLRDMHRPKSSSLRISRLQR
jgi:hypothetical protein